MVALTLMTVGEGLAATLGGWFSIELTEEPLGEGVELEDALEEGPPEDGDANDGFTTDDEAFEVVAVTVAAEAMAFCCADLGLGPRTREGVVVGLEVVAVAERRDFFIMEVILLWTSLLLPPDCCCSFSA